MRISRPTDGHPRQFAHQFARHQAAISHVWGPQ